MNCNSFDLGVLFLNPAQKLNYNFYYKVSQVQKMHTLRSLLNKPARLTILRKFSTLLAFIRSCSLIYLFGIHSFCLFIQFSFKLPEIVKLVMKLFIVLRSVTK